MSNVSHPQSVSQPNPYFALRLAMLRLYAATHPHSSAWARLLTSLSSRLERCVVCDSGDAKNCKCWN
jgi:hypothetical protein